MSWFSFGRAGIVCAVLAAFLLPIKLTLGYIGLIPLITIWGHEVLFVRRAPPEILQRPSVQTFILFLLIALATSAFGINPARSYTHIGTLLFFPLAIGAFYEASKTHIKEILFSLCAGQTLAALSAVLAKAFSGFSPNFTGPVAQSGQLTLTLFAALCLLTLPKHEGPKKPSRTTILYGSCTFLLVTLLGFSRALHLPATFFLLLLTAWIGLHLWRCRAGDAQCFHKILIHIILPVIFATLLVNLKRGPWIGVFTALCFYSYLHKPKVLLAIITASLLATITIEPIQSRIFHIHEHLFLAGGRGEIWNIGMYLISKYPLGIGFENSGFLRLFSTDIPQNLKHFHSNPLNILVETGWAGLMVYCLSMIRFFKEGFTSLKPSFYRSTTALSCGILAWQVAGLVEYNFGDSAVVSVAYLIIGVLLSKPFHSLHHTDVKLDL